jgi:peptide/nickel transport system permease protein
VSAIGRFVRQPVACLAAAFVAAVVLACALAGLIAPYDPIAQDLAAANQLPSGAHWLGTDSLGRDILSRLVHGGRVTLSGSVLAVAVFTALGLPLGLIAGYRRGLVDRLLGRLVEVVFATPVIVILLVVLSVFSSNLAAAMITLGVLGFGSLFRVVRASTMVAAGELYVKAARAAGLSAPAVLRRHILPNLWGQVIVQVALFSASAILTESGLAFLGFSIQPPNPSWGSMIGEASNVLSAHPFQLLPPGVLIGLVVLALGLVGDGVRDVAASRGAAPARPSRRRFRRGQALPDAVGHGPAGDRPGGSAGRALPDAVGHDPAEDRPGGPDGGGAAGGGAAGGGAAGGGGSDGGGEILLGVSGLRVEFGAAGRAVTVLEDAAFAVRPGEVLGVVGESGSGKTVMARALINLLPPGGRVAGGTVHYQGEPVFQMSPARLTRLRGGEIGYVPQEPMTTLDPVFKVGSLLGEVVRRRDGGPRAERRRRARELLALVRIADPDSVLSRYPHELSGGMAQRVAIALALAGRPRLLIADEPTTALDVTVQQRVLDLLDELRRRLGMAIVLVTHDWGVLADLADRALVMYAGQIVESGPTAQVYARPAHPYTRALIAANPATATPGQPLPSIPGQVARPGAWPKGCHLAERCALAMPACSLGPVALRAVGPGRASRGLLDLAAPGPGPADPAAGPGPAAAASTSSDPAAGPGPAAAASTSSDPAAAPGPAAAASTSSAGGAR